VKSREKSILLTCPICNQKISFKISEEELKNAKSELKIIKKAINHNNQHVIVVHLDSQGNVRRTYGYQCAEIGSKPDNVPNHFSNDSSGVSIVNIDNFSDNDPENFLKNILGNMEKSSKKT
jgi:hypothetical protein